MGKIIEVVPVKTLEKKELSAAEVKDGKIYVPEDAVSLTISGGTVKEANNGK